ncbi:MAG: hypothetical protein GWM87_10960, partial [Xanthomonadales bacterium]|nr:hypothetical protein [Xanthomonadales bacterium]NIX13398.1 hypothetical protein [Xanthomonadales bacterium]
MKLQCFKRTAMREECYCMDPGEIEDLLEQIGPKGTWDRRRDGGG